ncbi:MAG: multicopper oxidase domain-containing protein [Nitrospirae bacterium]|nr:multicopper oxidase domain-containing protein [Nitrospirota bacterium]
MRRTLFRQTINAISLSLLIAVAVFTGTSEGFIAGGSLDPTTIPKYTEELLVPPAMPKTGTIGSIDYYEIAARQFEQQVLPEGMPETKVWGYGSINHPGSFSYPARTIEAKVGKRVRVKWINDLRDDSGSFLPHILPVDQTLHWANPAQDCLDGTMMTDCQGQSQAPYAGPVPIITHLHGAHVGPVSDGLPTAWYLPAGDIPPGYAAQGSRYDDIFGGSGEGQGFAVFQYSNDQRPTTLWYHDHTLGMTRTNVYAGLSGYYLLRGGLSDLVSLVLPRPAPAENDPAGKKYYEIPILIQDRSFNSNGSLFYPDNRAFFEALNVPPTIPFLSIPFTPEPAVGGLSDVAPIWNPEFFGNTLVVNGKTWPYLNVEQRRYRFRLLNGSDSRFYILKFDVPLSFWQIGADGGYLPKKPVELTQLLIGPAERADVIVDFTNVPAGTNITLLNIGPDEPFGGGVPCPPGQNPDDNPGCGDFAASDPDTTGQVMQFRVGQRIGPDLTVPPRFLVLPNVQKLGKSSNTRMVSLNEEESATVFVSVDADGNLIFDPGSATAFGPTEAVLGTVNPDGTGNPLEFMDPITENPSLGATEIWEIHNFTEDAHPIHLHLVQFEIIDRTPMGDPVGGPTTRKPEAWETGTKDTVISYPGEVTRIKAKFDIPGLFIWHCHILSHEDNEMMRPYCVGNMANCQ